MVEDLICFFENLPYHMDKKKSPFIRAGSSRTGKIKKVVNDFTAIKRPPGKSKAINSNGSHEQSRTLPRSFKAPEDEYIKTYAKVTNEIRKKQEEMSQTCTNSNTNTSERNLGNKKTDININNALQEASDILPEIEKRVEEFGEKLKQKRTKQLTRDFIKHEKEEELTIFSVTFENQPESSLEENIQLIQDFAKHEKEDKLSEDNYSVMIESSSQENCDFFDAFDYDDLFGLNDFSQDCADNYIVETYNDYGKELIITEFKITRTSLSVSEKPDTIDELLHDSDFVFYKDSTGAKLEDLDIAPENVFQEDNHNDYSSEDIAPTKIFQEDYHDDGTSVNIAPEQVFEEDDQCSSADIKEQKEDDTISCLQEPDLQLHEHIRQNHNIVLEDLSSSTEYFPENDHIYYNDTSINSPEEEFDGNSKFITQYSSDSEIYEEIDESDITNYKINKKKSNQINVYVNTTVFNEEQVPFQRMRSERVQGDNFYHNLHDLQGYDSDDTFLEDNHSLSKDKNKLVKKDKISYVIDEMIKTEELYISSLRMVVKKYLPYLYAHTSPDLIGKTSYVFGNIEEIYVAAKIFLTLLKNSNESADEIAKTFIECSSSFDLYPLYSKNKPTADLFLKDFDAIVIKRQIELGDKLGLASHLLTPIQRLGKYILMLENIQKELNKTDQTLESVNRAINIIRTVMRKGNDSIAIDSIKQCKVDLSLQGSFIMRASFNILKPKKFMSMVFLFEKVIVFTQKVAKNMEQFNYVDSIQMSDLSLGKFEDKPYVFHLTDYPKLKKANHDAVTYVLEAETPKIKRDWTLAIEAKLWSQLQKAKEQQKQLNSDEGKRLSKVSLPINPLFRRHSSKKEKKPKPRSTFYDEHNKIGTP